MHVNKHAEIQSHVPFEGMQHSGLGVEFAEEGLAACTAIRIVNRVVRKPGLCGFRDRHRHGTNPASGPVCHFGSVAAAATLTRRVAVFDPFAHNASLPTFT